MGTLRQLPSGKWNAQVRLTGFKPATATHDTPEAAQAWINATEARLLGRRSQSLQEGSTPSKTSLEYVSQLYRQSLEFKKKRPSTQRTEERCSVAIERLLGRYHIEHIDPPVIQREFIDARAGEGYKGKPISGDTVRLEKAYLSAVFNFAVLRGIAKHNPVLRAKFQAPKPQKRLIRITPVQEEAVLSAALNYGSRNNTDKLPQDRKGDRLYCFLAYLFATGSRPGEASRIKLDWISEDLRTISVPQTHHKTDIPRVVLISDEFRPFLKAQIELAKASKSPFLFFAIRDPSKPYPYYHPVKTVFERAGLPSNYVPHGVRHEFISRLFEHSNLSDSVIANLVGDKTPLSLAPYTHLRTERLRPDFDEHSDTVRRERQKALLRARLQKK